jgi:hypothetical protein
MNYSQDIEKTVSKAGILVASESIDTENASLTEL